MTKLIPLDEVEKLFKKMKMGDNHEIQDYVKGWNEGLRITNSFLDDIPTIPTIDPIATIDKMIEERNDIVLFEKEEIEINLLQELKSRLSPKL